MLKIYIVIGLVMISALGVAQENDSIYRNQTGKIIGIALPGAMITYGALSLGSDKLRELDYSARNRLLENKAMWNKHWDDYMQFSPAVAAFGMKLAGMESVHKTMDMAILYALSNVVSTGAIYTAKHIVHRERPDGSNYFSFPSGHTATAFVAAEFLHQEYKSQSIWISVGGYAMASLIGVARIYNNKHWISDVVAGAGVGILSTKIVYLSYPYLQKLFSKKSNKSSAFIFPCYTNGALGLNIACTF